MPFPYYDRLSKSDKATYRKSDKLDDVPVPRATVLQPILRDIEASLRQGDRASVQDACGRLTRELLVQLEIETVTIKVLAVRPKSATSELHGLYEHDEGKRAVIRVWMRTAARKQPVAFRTFVRTLLHEVCHHLDYQLFGLADSFHTEGFFRRESHLMRQLCGPHKKQRRPPSTQLQLDY